MPAPTPGIDWAKIREEFETTDVSIGALRRAHGISSDTTITRRRDAEGWQRNGKFRAAAVVALQAEQAPSQPPHTSPHTPHTPTPHTPTSPADAGFQRSGVGERGKIGVAPVVAVPVAREAPALPVPVHERALFEERARFVQEQLREANRLIRTASLWLEHLATVAAADLGDPTDEEDLIRARAALQAINTDKDSTTSLAKSFTDMMVKGVAMKRQALGMDLPAAAGMPEAGTGPGRRDVDAMSIFEDLPLDVVRQIRDVGARRVQAALIGPQRPR